MLRMPLSQRAENIILCVVAVLTALGIDTAAIAIASGTMQ